MNHIRTFIISFMLLAFGRSSDAAPSVTNVRATQRSGTKLVDVIYDLAMPSGTAMVTLQVSDNGGTSYNIIPVSVSGDVGIGITPGIDRQLVWNAGLDRPGLLTSNMRFKVVADDGIPTDQELDASTLEFITRATAAGDTVVPSARKPLDDFVRECKRLNYWSTMVFVPCREGYGAMHTLGGSPRRTDTKFIRQGTTTLGPGGVSFVPGVNWANRVETPFSWNPAHEPIFVGVLGHTTTGNNIYPGHSFLRWGAAPTTELLATWNCGSAGYPVMMGFYTPGSTNAEFLLCNPQCTSIKRPNFGGAQFDGTHTLKCVHNNLSANLFHATATTGRPASGPVYFFQPADQNQTHVIQGCLLIYGDIGNLPIKDFWSIAGTTYLRDRPNKYAYLCIGGQSNAYFEIGNQLAFREWQSPTAPLFNYSNYRYGGQPISYWIGSNPNSPQRTSNYNSAKNTWLEAKPNADEDHWNGVYLWVQGESDTEVDQLAQNYFQQLTNFAGFLRQDLRNDLILAVAQIDYSIQHRTTANIGDFTISGCAGSASPANGNFAITSITGLANSFVNYTWTQGSFQLTRDAGTSNNLWRIHANGTTYFTADQNEPHPVLVTSWTASNGATGSPMVSSSRTGNIERVRKAQKDYVATDPKSFLVETRGIQRGMDAGTQDGVHMTVEGYTTLADRFATAYQPWSN